MKKFLLFLPMMLLVASSCSNGKKEEPQEKHTIYLVGHESEIGKYGDGTYLNTNSYYECPNCKKLVYRDDIFHECRLKNSGYGSSNGNQYGEGYEQGLEDAQNGLDYNPSGYGGNGQFKKGYEDGFNSY